MIEGMMSLQKDDRAHPSLDAELPTEPVLSMEPAD